MTKAAEKEYDEMAEELSELVDTLDIDTAGA